MGLTRAQKIECMQEWLEGGYKKRSWSCPWKNARTEDGKPIKVFCQGRGSEYCFEMFPELKDRMLAGKIAGYPQCPCLVKVYDAVEMEQKVRERIEALK